jgi:hypothetical protein
MSTYNWLVLELENTRSSTAYAQKSARSLQHTIVKSYKQAGSPLSESKKSPLQIIRSARLFSSKCQQYSSAWWTNLHPGVQPAVTKYIIASLGHTLHTRFKTHILGTISAFQGDSGSNLVDAIFLGEFNPPELIFLIQATTHGF